MENTTNSKIMAEKFNVSEETLRKWCRDHEIPFYLDRLRGVYVLPKNAYELIMSVKMVSLEERRKQRENLRKKKQLEKRQKDAEKAYQEKSERAKAMWRERKKQAHAEESL